jgi:uncharacterized protein YutE (UPF0331/DUF86 family)/predicted nucleotidyltransferase
MVPIVDALRKGLDQMPAVRMAVLFGSEASGTASPASDIDIGIAGDAATLDPAAIAVALERVVHRPIDLVLLDSAPPLLRSEISRHGRVLVEREPYAWADFRAQAMIDWWDWAPTAAIMRRAVAARLRRLPMVRADIVAAKAGRARAWLNDAAPALAAPLDAFVADSKSRDLALFYLFLAIQECIDLGAHWVADEGWAEPEDAGSTFDVLADRGIIDRDLATALRAAAGLRNRIAHGYAMLDYASVHREAQSGVPALRTFLRKTVEAAGV